MRNYFRYYMKKNLLPLACLTLFCVIIYVIPIATQNFSYWNDLDISQGLEYYRYPELYLGNLTAALCILSVLVPIAMFSYKMNRRSADMYYSLPLNKTKLLAVHFSVGLLMMYIAYTAAFLWGFAIVALNVNRLRLIGYLYFYLASLIPAFVAYSVTAFIFTRANTVLDGIVCIAGALCVFAAAIQVAYDIFSPFPWFSGELDSSYFFPFSPLSVLTGFFEDVILGREVRLWFTGANSYFIQDDASGLAGGILWLLLGIGAAVGLFLTERNGKAENCGQRSESIFCYKLLIPVYALFLSVIAVEEITFLCAVAFGAFVLSVIYKRSIKIGWKFALVLAACVIAGVLLKVISATICDSLYPHVID